MLKAGLGLLEGRRAIEDLFAVLNRGHSAAGKALPVATAIHKIDNRRVEVATPQKIRVQGVHNAVLINRGVGGLQCLAEHLTSVYLRTANVAAGTAKNVHFDPFKLQQAQQAGETLVHVAIRP